MKTSVLRTLAAGLAGGAALNGTIALTFGWIGYGWDGDGILVDPALQSEKLIAVWTEIEPIPLIVANPTPMVIGLFLFGIGHAVVYRWLAPVWPEGLLARTWRLGLLIWFLSFVFFEFFTPFNQYGEPLPLIVLQLLFWAVVAGGEALLIAAVLEWQRSPGRTVSS